jgi:xanthine dehydrogenase small subunit
MRTALAPIELLRPKSLAEALELLRDGTAVPVAGGTDIYVALQFGTLNVPRFLDVWPLDELREIHAAGGKLSIGALASYTSIIRSPLVQQTIPMLVAASREIGGVQIQNRGTLGGNIANGSPAGDSLPALLAADAEIVLRSAGETRRVPFANYYTGYRQSVKRPDELIVAIEIPPIDGTQWFRKVGTRAAQAISKIVFAGVRGPRPRVAIGSVAATPLRLARTEAALASGKSAADARRELESEISPIDDVRSTATYRRRVAGNLLEQFWRETAPA